MYKYVSIIIFLLFNIVCSFGQTQQEMNATARKDYEKVDKAMAVKYKLAMTDQNETGKKLLLEGQRAWIKYKEAHCKLESNSAEGGSLQPLIYYTCMTELTEERTKKLETLLNGL